MSDFYRIAGICLLILTALIIPATAQPDFDLYKELYKTYSPEEITAWLRDHEPLAEPPQKITETIDGIVFDSNYDNGSLQEVYSGGTNIFNCVLYTEPGLGGDYRYWFRFRMQGVAGRTITINIDHSYSPRPAIRIGDGPWRRTTAAETPSSSQVILSFEQDENEAELSFFEPMGYSETLAEVTRLVSGSPYASTEVIGQSYQGRDMWMVTVKDPNTLDEGKYRIWVHSRAHAGEVTSTHAMLGILEQSLEESPEGRLLRTHCIFNLIPLLNVDGVALGQTRWDSQGIDPERQWHLSEDQMIPEVLNLKEQVDVFQETINPIRVALNLHSTRGGYGDTFFFKHIPPSVTTSFETIQQNYIDTFNNACLLFENRNPQTSQLALPPNSNPHFIESYFWLNWGESVMAMTHEGHYYRRITDNEYITGDDYREIGHGLALALIEYFDLQFESQVVLQVY